MRITIRERQEYISELRPILDREHNLPDWFWVLIADADRAYISGAFYACLMISVNTLEKILRHLHDTPESSGKTLNTLILDTEMPEGLQMQLMSLQKWRSAWLSRSAAAWELRAFLPDEQLESFAAQAVKLLRQAVLTDSTEYEHLIPTAREAFQSLLESSFGNWKILRFQASDAISDGKGGIRQAAEGEEVKPGETMVPGGWDHTHCSFCLDAIRDNDRVLTNGVIWICGSCFDTYEGSSKLQENDKISQAKRIQRYAE